jgi:acetyl esterase/lipase
MALATAAVASSAAAAQRQQPREDHPPIYFQVPGAERVQVVANLVYKTAPVLIDSSRRLLPLTLDVYLPLRADSALRVPGIVFMHGGLVAGSPPIAKDWETFRSWGRIAAASGFVGVVPNHRMNTSDNVTEAAGDLEDALAFVRSHAREYRLDQNRLCVAFFSAGGPISSVLLRDPRPYIKCVVLYYPYLDLEHLRRKTPFRDAYSASHVDSLRPYSPRAALAGAPDRLPPIFLARAGRDQIPYLNESVARFIRDAVAQNITLDLVIHRDGVHGFDAFTPNERTHDIIAETLAFVRRSVGD